MRYQQLLVENTDSEIEYNKIIMSTYRTLTSELIKLKEPALNLVIGEGSNSFEENEEIMFYPGNSFDFEYDIVKQIAFLFSLKQKHNTKVLKGAFMSLPNIAHDGLIYNLGLLIPCLDNLTKEDVAKSIQTTSFLETFYHEMIHALDQLNYNSMFTKKKNSVHKENNNKSLENIQNEYFNDPDEVNAYYNQLSQSLLSGYNETVQLINNGDSKSDILDILDLFQIYPDFNKTLKRTLRNNEIELRQFLKFVSEDNRKKIIKRMYLIHKKIFDLINSI